MDWNIVLYIGMALIIGGFSLFLYSEMKLREIDRKLFLSEQLHKAFMEAKKESEDKQLKLF
jgi:hypothetical protein|tara:strand:+ start:125 stop:307 length:183 start_codon:yes stop_codon:yes gene_type:complete